MTSSTVALCLFCLAALSSACYIQNCPIGGKRSVLDVMDIRKCIPADHGTKATALGLTFAVGTSWGATLDIETMRCQEENYLPSPCESGRKSCGSNGGSCAASGICCNNESCTVDQACDQDSVFS